MGNYKWGHNKNKPTDGIKCVLFVSRNKDNKQVKNFKERRESFPINADTYDVSELCHQFDAFVNGGLPGEVSRAYVSVNDRYNKATMKQLQHYLLDNEIHASTLPQTIVKLAMKRENAITKKRLFDVDVDAAQMEEFLQDLKDRGLQEGNYIVKATVSGYAIVIERGIDLRGLVDTMPDSPMSEKKDKGPWKWDKDEIGYKIDDLLLEMWDMKPTVDDVTKPDKPEYTIGTNQNNNDIYERFNYPDNLDELGLDKEIVIRTIDMDACQLAMSNNPNADSMLDTINKYRDKWDLHPKED